MQPAERKRPGMRALFGSMALGLFASSSNGSKVVDKETDLYFS